MTLTPTRQTELLAEIDSTPWGLDERALLTSALSLAQEEGDEDFEYCLRMRLTASAAMTGDTDSQLASFVWCLGKHDSDPNRFPLVVAGNDLLWQFKWMAVTMAHSPIFSLQEIESALADMAARYSRAGVGESGVLQARFWAAHAVGQEAEAAALRDRLRATPRDEYSDCEACSRSKDATWLVSAGRLPEALVEFEEILADGLSCNDEPEYALAQAMIPYLRSGDVAKAKAAHLKSYRAVRSDPDDLGVVAKHVEFCVVTGNEARGLQLVERHLRWLVQDQLDADDQFLALGAFALLLDAVARAGHADAVVRGADSPELERYFGPHAGTWSAFELAPRAWAAAEDIAALFDARNGNHSYRARLERTRLLADERYHVPLSGPDFAPDPISLTVPEPADSAGWLERARERWGVGDVEGARVAARTGLAAARALPDSDDRAELSVRAELISTLLQIPRSSDTDANASPKDEDRLLEERIELLRRTGRPHQADVESELGLLVFGGATTEDDATVLEQALDRLERRGADARTIVRLMITVGDLRARLGDSESAVELFSRATARLAGLPDGDDLRHVHLMLGVVLAGRGDHLLAMDQFDILLAHDVDRALTAAARIARARLRREAGELEAALDDADTALDLHLRMESRAGAVDACILSATLLQDLGRSEEAVTRWRSALRHGEIGDLPRLEGLRFGLGRQLVLAGRGDEAAEVLSDVVDNDVASGAQPEEVGGTRMWLARAWRQLGESGRAYSAYVMAIDDFQAAHSPAEADARTELARLLVDFDDDDAVGMLEEAVAVARGDEGSLDSFWRSLHLLGQVRVRFGDATGLDDLDEVIRSATDENALWLRADVMDTKANCLVQLDRVDEAIALALEAADAYAMADDYIASGLADLLAGRLLAQESRAAEAVVVYQSAVSKLEALREAHTAANLELGQLLESMGRVDEAARAFAVAEDSRAGD